MTIDPFETLDANAIMLGYGKDGLRNAFDSGWANGGGRDPNRPSAAPAGWRKELIDARQLCDQKFRDLRYVVPGLFPEGVTLLASRPKLGKSWLMLQIGHAVAKGVSTLVTDNKPAFGDG
jgi:hypothetical protein